MAERVEQFVEALHHLEEHGDPEMLVGLFGENAEISNVTYREPMYGQEGVRHFWTRYREEFGSIRSTFEHIAADEHVAALEWHATGTIRQGRRPITYRGVTILEFRGDEISAMRAYYDPTPFMDALSTPAEQRHADVSAEISAPEEGEMVGGSSAIDSDEMKMRGGPYGLTECEPPRD
jgi:ketosteroid isomerase-like protein